MNYSSQSAMPIANGKQQILYTAFYGPTLNFLIGEERYIVKEKLTFGAVAGKYDPLLQRGVSS
ncbi:hypothetical protein [Paenibacillus elgii]|uniref:hypothetical protein n=1 Tax=Paenibacillus elgii TaxID=189691 RepID=UPI0013D59A35|nr:hypothetical protein [Paenibacillus elgii]